MDGNKRTGTHAMLILFSVELAYMQEELSVIVPAVASGKQGYKGLLCWLVEPQLVT